MRLFLKSFTVACGFLTILAMPAPAQTGSTATPAAGAIEFVARITPTAARAEPVRQFTFYLLTKSYAEIVRAEEAADPLPSRNEFIAGLKLSSQLKDWMKAHETMDLAASELEQFLSGEEIVSIPEFLDAYLHANSGGVTRGLPKPKYTDADRTQNPERYAQLRQEYLAALKKFIGANPQSLGGMEAYLDTLNPARKWNQITAEQRRRLQRRTPEVAQTRYLVAKADTDLEGRATLANVPPGNYWLSTLGLDAAAGDVRLHWDTAVTVEAGRTTRAELTNINASDSRSSSP